MFAKLFEILGIAIVANMGMPGMFSGEQHTARRSTHGIAGVVIREANAIAGEGIDIRRFDPLLPIATEFAVAEVIRHYEHYVRCFRLLGSKRLLMGAW